MLPLHPVSRPHAERAFTLVELSIVLVILGLLVGGVLAGQSLIRAAEIRSIGTTLNGFNVAMNAFRDKYFTLPGDMTNATSFWPSCGTTALTTAEGCNGNGDGNINEAGGTTTNESFRALQELALAGLVEGTYSGTFQSPVASVAGVAGCMRSKYPNTCFAVGWKQFPNSEVVAMGNNIFFGSVNATTASPWGASIPPGEMYNLDMKIDDGVSSTGRVVAWDGQGYRNASPNCNLTVYNSATLNHQYNLANTTPSCSGKYFLQ